MSKAQAKQILDIETCPSEKCQSDKLLILKVSYYNIGHWARVMKADVFCINCKKLFELSERIEVENIEREK